MENIQPGRITKRSSISSTQFFGIVLFFFTTCAASVAEAKTDTINRIDVTGQHPRLNGVWPQYTGLETALGKNVVITSAVTDSTRFENWQGKTMPTHDLSKQTPDNYDSTHNHYQNLLSEVWNSKSDANAVSIWGDATAIAQGSGVWGGFFSARSNYKLYISDFAKKRSAPAGLELKEYKESEYDAQLVGIEIDILNGGKPGVYPNKSKTGLQIVGFGNPNSMAIEVRCEDTDKDTKSRRGVWESGIYFKNSMAPYGRLIVADFDESKMGFDFRRSLFTEGIMQAKTNQIGTGIIYNEGKSGELYGGSRWGDVNEGSQWLSLRAGTGGLRVVSQDNTKELISVDNYGGIYLNGDVYINGKKLSDLLILDDRLAKLEKQLEALAGK
jgi:hypothetical protein